MSFMLLNSAHSISYVIDVVIFTKDLIEQSISLLFHFGKTFKLSVLTSFTLSNLFELRPAFASLSALSFQEFPLCPLTFVKLNSIFLALQHSWICLIKL